MWIFKVEQLPCHIYVVERRYLHFFLVPTLALWIQKRTWHENRRWKRKSNVVVIRWKDNKNSPPLQQQMPFYIHYWCKICHFLELSARWEHHLLLFLSLRRNAAWVCCSTRKNTADTHTDASACSRSGRLTLGEGRGCVGPWPLSYISWRALGSSSGPVDTSVSCS